METSFPIELIDNILSCENLSISDVVSFSLTNPNYYNAIRNLNTMWKRKYFQTWPKFSNLFEEKDCKICWYDEIQYIYDLKRRARKILSEMSVRLYKRYQLFGSDFKQWTEICDENPRSYYYLIHDIYDIYRTSKTAINTMKPVPITTPGNQTLMYYAFKVKWFLKHLQLTKEWLAYVSLPPRQRTLEKGAALVVQCCQTIVNVSWKDILPKQLDELAEKVKEHLKAVDPNHPLFSVPEKDLKKWRGENIEGNKYGVKHCRKVVQALERVFGYSHEHINSARNSSDILKNNSLFKEILAVSEIQVCGARKSLLLLYESVARRLGLKYEIIHVSREAGVFDLQVSEVFDNAKEDVTQRSQLSVAARDAFVDCLVNDPVQPCTQEHPNCMRCNEYLSDLQRLLLLHLLTPVIKCPNKFMKKCFLDCSDYSRAILDSVLEQRITELNLVRYAMELQFKEFTHKNRDNIFKKTKHSVRPANLKYAVGMLVCHRKRAGVICDWKIVSSNSGNKPVYNVLDRNGFCEVVEQDKLTLYVSKNYDFSLYVGRHFSHAFKTHFVPIAEKEKEYPADAAIRLKFHTKIMKARNK